MRNMHNLRKRLTYSEKRKIIKYADENLSKTQRDLAEYFNISVGALNNILKKRKEILDLENGDYKSKPVLNKTSAIDAKIIEWMSLKRSQGFIITDAILQQMAIKIAEKLKITDIVASNGWLSSFKRRHKIKSKTLNGEYSFVDEKDIRNFSKLYQERLTVYPTKNIYNVDETGLNYKFTGRKSLMKVTDDNKSVKLPKDRLTILCCVSMCGEKRNLLVIGNAKKPRGFKGREKIISGLNMNYKSSKKSWMTSALFLEWLVDFNEQMKTENRKILLTMDNAPVHLVNIGLSNIEILFYPKNTTSRVQPCDQGIIKTLKDKYRAELLSFLIDESEDEKLDRPFTDLLKKIDVFRSLLLLNRAWTSIKEESVVNCWKKALNESYVSKIEDDVEFYNDESIYEPLDFTDDQFLDIISGCPESSEEEETEGPRADFKANITYYEAYRSLEILETWFIENSSADLKKILDLKDIIKAKRKKEPKILDFMVGKEN